MPRSLTASDRSALIKLASSMPKGSEERKAILAGLTKVAVRIMGEKLPDLPRGYKWVANDEGDFFDIMKGARSVGSIGLSSTGTWLSYVGNANWPSGGGHSDAEDAAYELMADLDIE